MKLTVHSLEPALTDSLVVVDIADKNGITQEQVRGVLADLDDLEVRQVLRLCKAGKARRVATVNRQTRKAER